MSVSIQKTKADQEQLTLPDFFRPIMWSYNFGDIDKERNKKTIIVNTINYGDLKHWKWIKDNYGINKIQNVLAGINATELRPPALKLASLIFSITKLNYAPRGTK